MNMNIPSDLKVVNLLAPAADAAGRTSSVYASLKNVVKAWVVAYITQGHAATVQLDPLQATAVAGTGSKALTNDVPIWAALDVATSDALAAATAAKNYTTDAAVKNKIVVFEIEPKACMDLAGGFDCIGVSTGASNAGNITSAFLIVQNKWGQATPPSQIVD